MILEQEIQALRRFNKREQAIEQLGEQIQNLVRLETQKGSSFINVSDDILLRIMTEHHSICLHEVLLLQQSKIYFDIDLKITSEQLQTLRQLFEHRWERRLMGLVMDQIILLFKENNGHLQNPQYSDFDVFKSSREDAQSGCYKISWHLVLFPLLFCADKADLRFGAFELNKRINSVFKNIHQQLFIADVNLIDAGVYRQKGNLRIAGCSKPGVNAPKKKEEWGEVFPDELPSRYLVGKTKNQQGAPLQLIKLFPMEQFTQQPAIKSRTMNSIDPQNAVTQLERVIKALKQKLGIEYIQHKFLENQVIAVTYAGYGVDGICPVCIRQHDRNHLYSMINIQTDSAMLNCFRNTNGNATGQMKPAKYMDLDGNEIGASIRQTTQQEYIDLSTVETTDEYIEQQDGQIAKSDAGDILHCFKQHLRAHEDIDWESYGIQTKEINEPLICEYPENAGALFIKSQMGTGKTKQLMAFMDKYVQEYPNNRIVILSFRVSFSGDHRMKINSYFKQQNIDCEFKLYSELPIDKISDCQYLIIQVESLRKLGLLGLQCNLFIMDESESLIQQLNSNLSQYETLNFCIFENLLTRSDQVLCMDAFLSIRTVDTVCKIRDKIGDKIKAKEYRQLIHNKWQEKKSYNFFIGEKSSATWLQILVDDIKAGKKVVIPCNVALVARTVYDIVCSQFPDLASAKQICLYTQDVNKHQKKIDLDNIKEAWKQYTVLIYSPTILAGISFEERHYDKLHGYFKLGINPVENFMQMCGRVRNLEEKTYNILIIEDSRLVAGFKPVTLETIDRRIKQDIVVSSQSLPCGITFELDCQGDIQIQNQGYYRTFLHNQRVYNLSANSPLNRFLVCIGYNDQRHNLTITQKDKSEGVSIQEQKKELRKKDFEEMKRANTISKDEAHILFSLPDEQLNDRDRRELEKYNMRVQLQIAHLNRDVVGEMNTVAEIQQWLFLQQYTKMRKQFTTTKNYLSQYRIQNVVSSRGDDIMQKTLEYDAQMLINQTVQVQQMKIFEILLNALGLHQDVFYSDDINEYSGVTVESWLAKLCMYHFLLTVQEVHLKQFSDIAQQRFQLIKITNAILQQIDTQLSLKEILRHCVSNEILIVGKRKSKEATNQVVKIIKSILQYRFGIEIQCCENGDLHFQPKSAFMDTILSDRSDIKIQNFDIPNSSIRKIVTLLWLFLDNIPKEWNMDGAVVQQCENKNHYNRYLPLPEMLFAVIKARGDIFQKVSDVVSCGKCATWIQYAIKQGAYYCKNIQDIRQIMMINNYNYYNEQQDVALGIKKSLEDIIASQRYHK